MKKVLCTGATAGIGFHTAQNLAVLGASDCPWSRSSTCKTCGGYPPSPDRQSGEGNIRAYFDEMKQKDLPAHLLAPELQAQVQNLGMSLLNQQRQLN